MVRLQSFEAFITGLIVTLTVIPQAVWAWILGYIAGLATNALIRHYNNKK